MGIGENVGMELPYKSARLITEVVDLAALEAISSTPKYLKLRGGNYIIVDPECYKDQQKLLLRFAEVDNNDGHIECS